MGFWNLGFPYSAGSFVTSGGLIFNAGVTATTLTDGHVRAIDVLTGKVMWEDELRTSSDATPMTYVSPKTGRQYVLVTVPGSSGFNIGEAGTPTEIDLSDATGGQVIAYALPEG